MSSRCDFSVGAVAVYTIVLLAGLASAAGSDAATVRGYVTEIGDLILQVAGEPRGILFIVGVNANTYRVEGRDTAACPVTWEVGVGLAAAHTAHGHNVYWNVCAKGDPAPFPYYVGPGGGPGTIILRPPGPARVRATSPPSGVPSSGSGPAEWTIGTTEYASEISTFAGQSSEQLFRMAFEDLTANGVSADISPDSLTLTVVVPDSQALILYHDDTALDYSTETTDIETILARVTQLNENVPNPFNPTTQIRFDLAREGRAELRVLDVMGRRVRTLLNDRLASGPHEVVWNGHDDAGMRASPGIYFAQLETGGFTAMQKMILLR